MLNLQYKKLNIIKIKNIFIVANNLYNPNIFNFVFYI